MTLKMSQAIAEELVSSCLMEDKLKVGFQYLPEVNYGSKSA
jgi:hypothetical protein